MPFQERRSADKFTQHLSMVMMVIASLAGFLVLIDPVWTYEAASWSLHIGSEEGFSKELKGAVMTMMMIGGYTSVKEFWLGSSAGGQISQESVARIAESAAPVAAAAVAAASGMPAQPAQVNVEKAESVQVNGKESHQPLKL